MKSFKQHIAESWRKYRKRARTPYDPDKLIFDKKAPDDLALAKTPEGFLVLGHLSHRFPLQSVLQDTPKVLRDIADEKPVDRSFFTQFPSRKERRMMRLTQASRKKFGIDLMDYIQNNPLDQASIDLINAQSRAVNHNVANIAKHNTSNRLMGFARDNFIPDNATRRMRRIKQGMNTPGRKFRETTQRIIDARRNNSNENL